ncbi:hypothetical protein DFO55_11528 [Grimontella sp. AG753]|nr:hypothetical protein DFO55_11528 [Grimontella sp. AG753]
MVVAVLSGIATGRHVKNIRVASVVDLVRAIASLVCGFRPAFMWAGPVCFHLVSLLQMPVLHKEQHFVPS